MTLWREIHNEFAAQIAALPDPEFTKTFFSSISRRLFGTVGVAPDIEFVATDLDPLANIHTAVGTQHLPQPRLAVAAVRGPARRRALPLALARPG